MKTKIFLLAAAFLLAVQGAGAQQEAAEVDSVMLAGKVVNHHSHRIYRNCYMRFVQEGRTVAETVTDTVGEFVVAALPVGRVELHVKLKGLLFHQADLDLHENAYLTVAVDTIKLITLKAITVVATKHMLGSMQITLIHDRRLWGFNGGYRDANASVALPPDAHGNSDAGEDGGVGGDGPVGTPLFDPMMPWQIRHALMTGKLGTLLMSPPIWEVVPDRVVKADSTRSGAPAPK
jgi:hypothetical protein